MQKLLVVAERVRTHYVTGFRQVLESFVSSHSGGAAEVLFEVPGEALPVFRLYRVDMAAKSKDDHLEVNEVDVSTHVDFDPFAANEPGGMKIAVQPITWNAIDFRAKPDVDLGVLEAWAMRWLDVDDEHATDSDGFQNVVHAVTEPTRQADCVEFGVDFGSAPVEALLSLLTALSASGTTQIELSSCITATC